MPHGQRRRRRADENRNVANSNPDPFAELRVGDPPPTSPGPRVDATFHPEGGVTYHDPAMGDVHFGPDELDRMDEIIQNYVLPRGDAEPGTPMEGRNTHHFSGEEIPPGAVSILDHGFVRLVRTNVDDRREGEADETSPAREWWNAGTGRRGLTPGDAAIVDAARVSYAEGTRRVRSDEGLIRYLMRHHHSTPFEAPDFTLHIKVPIFIARQAMRHRTFTFDEVSYRYSEIPRGQTYLPEASQIRAQSATNRQGGGDIHPHAEAWQTIMRDHFDRAEDRYRGMLSEHAANGGVSVARETARIIMPVATYTEFHMKGNLWNWLRFLHQRIDAHAQWEIRQMAQAILDILEPFCPVAFQAWRDYHLNAVHLSQQAAAGVAWLIHDLGVEIAELRAEQRRHNLPGAIPAEHDPSPDTLYGGSVPVAMRNPTTGVVNEGFGMRASRLEQSLRRAGVDGRELTETLTALRGARAARFVERNNR